MEPISRSAYAFCQGERGAVRTSSMPMARRRRRTRGKRMIAIVNEIARRYVLGKRLTELLGRPRRRRTLGDRDVHDAAALMGEDHQHEQQSTSGGRHDEEVRGQIWWT